MPGVLNLYTFKIHRDEREKERERGQCPIGNEKNIYLHEDQKYEASMDRVNIYV